MSNTTTTAQIDTMFANTEALTAQGLVIDWPVPGRNIFTVTFTDTDEALAAVDAAKAQSWTEYLNAGGNRKNKRSFGSQFAAIKRAITKAAA